MTADPPAPTVDLPRRRMIALRDGEASALEFGDPDRPIDVVFCHANGFNALTYRSVLGPLAGELRILALDLRGHGASTLPADAHRYRRSWSVFRRDLVEVVDQSAAAQPGHRLVLAGHSLGSIVSLLAADKRPAAVKAVVLLEPVLLPYWASVYAALPWVAGGTWRKLPLAVGALRRRDRFSSPELAMLSYRGRGAFKTWPEEMLRDYLTGGLRPLPDGEVELACAPAWEAANYAAQANDSWGAIRRLKRPILLYRAEHGSSCFADPSALARRNPLLQIRPVPGTTHFLPMERPDVAQAALREAAAL